ncbi:MAG: Protein RecA [Parcubacteria group bacterium GW2011_GWB1_56_8]|nr:MAG: Protein RecA [Parcubacteria group bacterium GW2011_GWB1_56_8]
MSSKTRAQKLSQSFIDDAAIGIYVRATAAPISVMPTGNDAFDVATRIGGLPEGRIVMVAGAEASGKSTFALECAAEVQRRNGLVVYLDFECKLDLSYAKILGVDVEQMVIARPSYIEKGFEMLDVVLRKAREEDEERFPILIIWDSLHGAQAKRTFEGDYEAEGFSPESLAYAKCMRKFVSALERTNAVMLAISQVRSDIGAFITKDKIGVGRACRFYASLVAFLRAKEKIASSGGPIGERIEATITKNQVGDPWRLAKWPLYYGKGVDKAAATLSAAEAVGVAVAGKKGWLQVSVGGATLPVHGGAGFAKLAESDPALYAKIREEIRALIGKTLPAVVAPPDEATPDGKAAEAPVEVPR